MAIQMGKLKCILAVMAMTAMVMVGFSSVSAFPYSATYISFGSTNYGYLDYQGDSDYYEFYASSGTSILITLTDPTSADYDIYLHSYSSSGSHYSALASSTSTADTTTLTYTITSTDYYYIEIYAWSYSSYDYSYTVSLNYDTSSMYITVTNPDSYDSWYAGTSYYIQWDYSSGLSSYVSISIDTYPYSSSYATSIDSYTSNDGSYYWTVPSSYSSGTYVIRVADYYYSSTYYDNSDSFYIYGSSSSPYITVTNPDSYDSWYAGTSYYIQWDYSSGLSSYVSISIDTYPYSSSYATTIDSATSNDGSYYWTIPSSYTSGTYVIRVADYYYGSTYYDNSDSFYIYGSSSSPYITVTNPDSYDSWYAGTSYYIQWDYSSGLSSYVSISIDTYPYSSSYATSIDSYTSNDGSYYWTVPSSYTSGTYVIRVADYYYGSTYYDNSESFYIYGSSSYSSISVGGTTSGYLTSTGDSDWYQIYLSSGEQIVIELDGPYGEDFDLDLYDSSYNTVASGSASGDDTITYHVPTSGYYYIEVSSYSGTGYYALSSHYGSSGSSIPIMLIIIIIVIVVVIVVVVAAVAASKKKEPLPPPTQPGADQGMYQQYDPATGQPGQVTFQQWQPPPGGQPPQGGYPPNP